MAGSVGIGGLIIGVSLLVVFSMAIQTIGYQMESSLDTLETAAEPLPSFTVDSSDIWEHALVDASINAAGEGYVNGTLLASAGGVPCEGFVGNFSVDGIGAIVLVVVTSPGNCASSTPTISFGTPTQNPVTPASFTESMRTFVFANLTNNGPVTLPTEEVWMFTDGTDAESIANSNGLPAGVTSTNWYSGETLNLFWNKSSTSHGRLAFTFGGLTVGTNL